MKSRTHGEVIQHASFDHVLWTEMIPKMMLDDPDMPTIRPTVNWGVQYHTLVLKGQADEGAPRGGLSRRCVKIGASKTCGGVRTHGKYLV